MRQPAIERQLAELEAAGSNPAGLVEFFEIKIEEFINRSIIN